MTAPWNMWISDYVDLCSIRIIFICCNFVSLLRVKLLVSRKTTTANLNADPSRKLAITQYAFMKPILYLYAPRTSRVRSLPISSQFLTHTPKRCSQKYAYHENIVLHSTADCSGLHAGIANIGLRPNIQSIYFLHLVHSNAWEEWSDTN